MIKNIIIFATAFMLAGIVSWIGGMEIERGASQAMSVIVAIWLGIAAVVFFGDLK